MLCSFSVSTASGVGHGQRLSYPSHEHGVPVCLTNCCNPSDAQGRSHRLLRRRVWVGLAAMLGPNRRRRSLTDWPTSIPASLYFLP